MITFTNAVKKRNIQVVEYVVAVAQGVVYPLFRGLRVQFPAPAVSTPRSLAISVWMVCLTFNFPWLHFKCIWYLNQFYKHWRPHWHVASFNTFSIKYFPAQTLEDLARSWAFSRVIYSNDITVAILQTQQHPVNGATQSTCFLWLFQGLSWR